MNDETRKALVDNIAKRIDTFAEHVGYGDPDVTREEATSYIAEIEEALLADRAATVAEPDEETVERVAKAIFHVRWGEVMNLNAAWDGAGQSTRDNAMDMARAAIAAMPSGRDDDVVTRTLDANTSTPPLHMAAVMSGGDPNWLDAALDSVHPETYVSYVLWESGSQGSWRACIRWPDSRMSARWGYPHLDSVGHGTTRREAILNAVQKAKEEASDANT